MDLVDKVQSGSIRGIARTISLIENNSPQKEDIIVWQNHQFKIIWQGVEYLLQKNATENLHSSEFMPRVFRSG